VIALSLCYLRFDKATLYDIDDEAPVISPASASS